MFMKWMNIKWRKNRKFIFKRSTVEYAIKMYANIPGSSSSESPPSSINIIFIVILKECFNLKTFLKVCYTYISINSGFLLLAASGLRQILRCVYFLGVVIHFSNFYSALGLPGPQNIKPIIMCILKSKRNFNVMKHFI